MRGQNRHRSRAVGEERCHRWWPRGLEMDHHLVGTVSADAFYEIVTTRALHVVTRIDDRVPRELDVTRAERYPILPPNVAPEKVGDRAAVAADAAVFKCRHAHR